MTVTTDQCSLCHRPLTAPPQAVESASGARYRLCPDCYHAYQHSASDLDEWAQENDRCPTCHDTETVLNPAYEEWELGGEDCLPDHVVNSHDRYSTFPGHQNRWCAEVGAPPMWIDCPNCSRKGG